MKKHSILTVFFSLLLTCGSGVYAQAPATLMDFTNKVVTLTISNSTTFAIGAVRILANSNALTSGYFLVGASFGPTNAAYSPLAPDRGLLSMFASPGATYLETNHIALTFATGTNGVFTNQILRPSLQPQTNTGTFTLTSGTNIPPIITFVTPSQIVQSNSSRGLTVSAAGFGNAYQWRLEGTNLPGQILTSLSVNNIQPHQLGDYTCVVTNSAGSITSKVVNISYAIPAGFSLQPQSLEVLEGAYLTIPYAATGSISSAEWYRDGGYVANANSNAAFVAIKAAVADAGNYYVRLDNYGIARTSEVATVSVRRAGLYAKWLERPFVKVADEKTLVPGFAQHRMHNWGNAAYTPLLTFREGKVHFVAGTTAGVRSLFRWTNGVLSTLVFTNTPNPLGGDFGDTFYPTDEGNGTVNFSSGGMFAWSNGVLSTIIGTNTPVPGRATNVLGGPGSFGRRGTGVAISSTIFTEPNSFVTAGTGMFFHDGNSLSLIADNLTDLPGVMTGYAFRPTANSVNFDGTTIVFSTITGFPANQGGFFKATVGGPVVKLADSGDASPGGAAYSDFGDLDLDGELIFGVANSVVYAFDTNNVASVVANSLNVSAAGPRMAYYHDGGFLYRWNNGVKQAVLFSGQIVDGKSVSQILRMDAQGDDVCVLLKFTDNTHGIYIVYGPQPEAPIIVSEPLDFNVLANGNAPFYFNVAGAAPLSFQWFKNGDPIPSGTNATLTVANVQPEDVTGYQAIATNSFGSVTSRVAQLTRSIPPLPIVLSGPSFLASGVFGSNTTVTVTTAGEEPLFYTWRREGVPLPGATNASLSLTNLGVIDRANYSVAITNANGGVVSSAALLTIAPVILQQPVSTTNVVGGSASFTVVGDGIPPLSYQWRRGAGFPNTIISGATSPTLTFTNLSLTNAQNYRVFVISTGNGSVSSSTVSLGVLSAATPNSPHLTAQGVVSGVFHFLLPTQNGFTYYVQSKTNLAGAEWTAEQAIIGDGTVKLVPVDAGAQQKSVRVKVE